MHYAELNRDDREDLYAFLCRRLAWGDLSASARAWLSSRAPRNRPLTERESLYASDHRKRDNQVVR
jgi:hypothetical protein